MEYGWWRAVVRMTCTSRVITSVRYRLTGYVDCNITALCSAAAREIERLLRVVGEEMARGRTPCPCLQQATAGSPSERLVLSRLSPVSSVADLNVVVSEYSHSDSIALVPANRDADALDWVPHTDQISFARFLAEVDPRLVSPRAATVTAPVAQRCMDRGEGEDGVKGVSMVLGPPLDIA